MAGTEMDCRAEDGPVGTGNCGPQVLPDGQPPDTAELLARLVRTIEGEIVPRLMLVQRAPAAVIAPAAADLRAERPDVSGFVVYLLRNDAAELSAYVESLRARGLSAEVLLLDLFAPAARRLGRMWEEDTCSFTDVTLALSQLHRLVHQLRHDRPGEFENAARQPRALLTVTENEQHLFGLLVVADCFRSGGWRVDEDLSGTANWITTAVRGTSYDLVGVSVSSEDRIDRAAELVRAVRRHSRNPAVRVMAGGPVFLRVPEISERLGVDAVATDARQAVARARDLVATMAAAKTGRV